MLFDPPFSSQFFFTTPDPLSPFSLYLYLSLFIFVLLYHFKSSLFLVFIFWFIFVLPPPEIMSLPCPSFYLPYSSLSLPRPFLFSTCPSFYFSLSFLVLCLSLSLLVPNGRSLSLLVPLYSLYSFSFLIEPGCPRCPSPCVILSHFPLSLITDPQSPFLSLAVFLIVEGVSLPVPCRFPPIPFLSLPVPCRIPPNPFLSLPVPRRIPLCPQLNFHIILNSFLNTSLPSPLPLLP